jgi:hypothetical protein
MALTDSLVSYWKLDETSGTRSDAHGSNDLTDNNTVGSATGIINNGADFERGNSEYLNCGGADFDVTDHTISFWVKLESTPGSTMGMVCRYADATNRTFYVYINGSNQVQYIVRGASASNIVVGPTVSTGGWYHIVARYDDTNKTIELDVNGTNYSNTATAGIRADNITDLEIGQLNGAYFDGIIDEVGFWSRTLTDGEVAQLYNSGAGLAYPFGVGLPGRSYPRGIFRGRMRGAL